MSAPSIVVVGSYNRDIAMSVAHLPAPGETCLSLGRLESPGGKGANQAIQAARCGAAVTMLAALGRDEAGEEAIATWRAAGVDTAHVARLESHGTGMAVILVDERGENSIVVDSGANAALTPTHIEAAAEVIGRCRIVVAQLETPLDATRRAFEIARAAGARTLLNAAPAPGDLDPAIIALTDILVVNEGEGLALTGAAHEETVGEALLARVGDAVVLTLGSQGAILFRRGATPLRRPTHKVRVIDTTGAGDAFIGAFAAELAQSDDYGGALANGLAAGALACTVMGAAASFAAIEAISSLAGAAANPA
jgi:ribokinase